MINKQTVFLGLVRLKSCNLISGSNLISYLKRNNVIEKEVFSICFSETGGFLTIGDYNNLLNEELMVLHMEEKSTRYLVKGRNISVGNSAKSIEGINFLIDSGTTLAQFNPEIHNYLVNSLSPLLSVYKVDIDFRLNQFKMPCFSHKANYYDLISNLPVIELFFSNKNVLSWKPSNYVQFFEKEICLSYFVKEGSECILGTAFLVNFHMVFDLEKNQLLVGSHNCGSDYRAVTRNRFIDKNKKMNSVQEYLVDNYLAFIFMIIIVAALVFVLLLLVLAGKRKSNNRRRVNDSMYSLA